MWFERLAVYGPGHTYHPVGVNVDIIRDGENGFLASTADEWVEKISRLLDSPELRLAMGQKGKETLDQHYSVEAVKGLYLKYLNSLHEG